MLTARLHSSSNVKNEWSYKSTPPPPPLRGVDRGNFIFIAKQPMSTVMCVLTCDFSNLCSDAEFEFEHRQINTRCE